MKIGRELTAEPGKKKWRLPKAADNFLGVDVLWAF